MANLWIPFQIMGDIWRAGLAQERSKTAWLPALWWATWLFGGGPRVLSGSPAAGAGRIILSMSPGIWSASLIPLAVAAVTLVAITRTVSNGPVGTRIR